MEVLLNILNSVANSISALLFFPLWTILIIFLNKIIPLINSKHFTLNISIATNIVSIIFASFCFLLCLNNPTGTIENNILWINSDIRIFLGTLVDLFSSAFLLISGILFLFYQIYTYKFIKEDKNFHKFYIYLNFLMFAIFGLILSSNLIQSFIFILLLSFCYYLLTSTTKLEDNTNSAKKYLLLSYFGDSCLLINILVLTSYIITFNSTSNTILTAYSELTTNLDILNSMLTSTEFIIIGILTLMTISIKLAQILRFPSHLKPNSLNNISTQISVIFIYLSGIYLIQRLYTLLILSNLTLYLQIIIGIISLLFVISFFIKKKTTTDKNLLFEIIKKISIKISKLFITFEEKVINEFNDLILFIIKISNYYILKIQNKTLKNNILIKIFILLLSLLVVFIFYLFGTMVEV